MLMFNNRMTQLTLQPGTYFDVTDWLCSFEAVVRKSDMRQRSCKTVATQRVYNRLEGGLATLQSAAAAKAVPGKLRAIISLN
jgi:hypothetical protein